MVKKKIRFTIEVEFEAELVEMTEERMKSAVEPYTSRLDDPEVRASLEHQRKLIEALRKPENADVLERLLTANIQGIYNIALQTGEWVPEGWGLAEQKTDADIVLPVIQQLDPKDRDFFLDTIEEDGRLSPEDDGLIECLEIEESVEYEVKEETIGG